MPASKEIRTELLATARRLYEDTNHPVIEIAKLLEMAERTFHERRRKWGWRARMASRKAQKELLTTAEEAAQESALFAEAPADDGRPAADRLRAAVEREIAAVQRRGEKVDSESAARTLASLARTLTEIKRLEAGQTEPAKADDDQRDVDEFRRELTRRLADLCAEGEAG